MADEVKAGDVLSYSLRGGTPAWGSAWESWPNVAQCCADAGAPAVDVVSYPLSASETGFTLTLQSAYDRARLTDIKNNLDSSIAACGGMSGFTSTLVFISKVPRASSPVNPNVPVPGTPPGVPPSPSSQKPDMFDQLAAQFGVKKDMIWWGLGGIALLLVMRK